MRAAADRIAVRLQELAIGQDEDTRQDFEEEFNSEEKAQHRQNLSDNSVSQFTHFPYQHLPQEVEA